MTNVLEILNVASENAKKIESGKISAKLTTSCFMPEINESFEIIVLMRSFFKKSPSISSGVITASENSDSTNKEIIFHADADTLYQKENGQWRMSPKDVAIDPVKESNKLSQYYPLFKKMEEKLNYAVVDEKVTLSLTMSTSEILENTPFFESALDDKVPLDSLVSISFFMTFSDNELSFFQMSTKVGIDDHILEVTAESTISERNQHNDLIIPSSVIQAALS